LISKERGRQVDEHSQRDSKRAISQTLGQHDNDRTLTILVISEKREESSKTSNLGFGFVR